MSLSFRQDLPPQVLADVALGRSAAIPRGRAINLLPTSGRPDALSLLRQVLDDESDDPRHRRLAAIALWRLGGAKAHEALLGTLDTIRNPTVLAGVVKALGRVGDERALAALESLRGRTEGLLAESADFAASLIAYRLGLPGHELEVLPPAEGPPRSARGRIELARPSADEAALFARALDEGPYGIPIDKNGLWQIRCPGGLWMLALAESFTGAGSHEALAGRKAVLGLIASKSTADGSYAVAYLVFSDPRGGELDLRIHRATGEAAWAGTLGPNGEGPPTFAIHTVGRVGIAPIEIEGIWRGGAQLELKRGISATFVAGKQNPVPFEMPRST